MAPATCAQQMDSSFRETLSEGVTVAYYLMEMGTAG